METKSHISENLRFLLWQTQIEKKNWVDYLAEWAKCVPRHAKAVLERGETLTPAEQELVARETGIPEDELVLSRLLQPQQVLQGNVQYLLDILERGEQKMLAEWIGASQTTLSRWHSGVQVPRGEHLRKLCRYFGLSPDVLEDEPLFLSLSPISDRARKEWLCEHIQQLSSKKLRKVFPTLELLLRDP